jgi:hypothetical protein
MGTLLALSSVWEAVVGDAILWEMVVGIGVAQVLVAVLDSDNPFRGQGT